MSASRDSPASTGSTAWTVLWSHEKRASAIGKTLEPTSWNSNTVTRNKKRESNAVKHSRVIHTITHKKKIPRLHNPTVSLWHCDRCNHKYKLYHTCVDGHVVLARLAVCRDRLPSANWLQSSFTSTGVQKLEFSTKQKIKTGRCIFSRMKAMRNTGLKDFSSTHP